MELKRLPNGWQFEFGDMPYSAHAYDAEFEHFIRKALLAIAGIRAEAEALPPVVGFDAFDTKDAQVKCNVESNIKAENKQFRCKGAIKAEIKDILINNCGLIDYELLMRHLPSIDLKDIVKACEELEEDGFIEEIPCEKEIDCL